MGLKPSGNQSLLCFSQMFQPLEKDLKPEKKQKEKHLFVLLLSSLNSK